uniref:Uncharacterized protein n=1 Tax=Opuntia streptacantha TaxID=393608 RepID=A0A7C9D2F7_OPUST
MSRLAGDGIPLCRHTQLECYEHGSPYSSEMTTHNRLRRQNPWAGKPNDGCHEEAAAISDTTLTLPNNRRLPPPSLYPDSDLKIDCRFEDIEGTNGGLCGRWVELKLEANCGVCGQEKE